jgi:hypothetical protein
MRPLRDKLRRRGSGYRPSRRPSRRSATSAATTGVRRPCLPPRRAWQSDRGRSSIILGIKVRPTTPAGARDSRPPSPGRRGRRRSGEWTAAALIPRTAHDLWSVPQREASGSSLVPSRTRRSGARCGRVMSFLGLSGGSRQVRRRRCCRFVRRGRRRRRERSGVVACSWRWPQTDDARGKCRIMTDQRLAQVESRDTSKRAGTGCQQTLPPPAPRGGTTTAADDVDEACPNEATAAPSIPPSITPSPPHAAQSARPAPSVPASHFMAGIKCCPDACRQSSIASAAAAGSNGGGGCSILQLTERMNNDDELQKGEFVGFGRPNFRRYPRLEIFGGILEL